MKPVESNPMKSLRSTIPDDVLSRIEGKKAIEAGVATGPSFMIFKGTTFDPPADLEQGLKWIVRTIPSFKAAHLKLDDLTVLWFRFNEFDKYQKKPVKAPIRPEIRISGHKVEPIRANG